MENKKIFTTKMIVIIGIMGTVSAVLMLFELPVIAFLNLDASDVPATIISMIYGPVPGIFIELVKNLIKIIFSSKTAFIGELANFIVGSAYIIPIGIIFKKAREKGVSISLKKKIFATACGTIFMAFIGALANYLVLIPFYGGFMGGEDKVIGFVKQAVSVVETKLDVILLVITPFNILKGVVLAVVCIPLYKSIAKKFNQ